MATKYTFVLAAYKAKFLKESIASILNQNYADFKLIVSDDCSPENLKPIVDSFSDERLSYRRNEVNMGGKDLVAHWNLLVGLVDTEFLIMASDDDVYERGFLAEIDRLVCKYPQVDQFRARVQMINESEEVFWEDLHYEEFQSQLKFCAFNPNTCVANNVFRTSRLKAIGGFVSFPMAWSSDLATEMAMSTNGVVNTDRILFNFRQSGINISSVRKNKETDKKKLEAVFQFHNWASLFISEMKFDKTLLNTIYYNQLKVKINTVVIDQCVSSSWALSFLEYIRLYRKLKKGGYFFHRSVLLCSMKYFISRYHSV